MAFVATYTYIHITSFRSLLLVLTEEVGHGHVTYVHRQIYMEVYYSKLCPQ